MKRLVAPSYWDAFRGWIFDLDGTLTVGRHDFKAMRAELGLPDELPILEALTKLAPSQREKVRERLTQIEWEVARETEVAEGAYDLLHSLSRQNRPVAILTRNDREIALYTLKAAGLDGFFDPSIVLGRDCAKPKPSPEGILHILDKWQLPAHEVVMLGDYVFDLQAGKSAGTGTVHVAQTAVPEWAAYADVYCASLREIDIP